MPVSESGGVRPMHATIATKNRPLLPAFPILHSVFCAQYFAFPPLPLQPV